MMKLFPSLALILLAAAVASARQTPQREKDGPRAKVRTVRVERAMTEMVSGQILEGPRELSSTLVYDAKGRLTEEALYFNGVLNGRTTYKYDSKGNRSEIVELNSDGSISGKSALSYEEFDAAGNWTKAVVSEWRSTEGQPDFRRDFALYRTLTYWDN